MTIDPRYTAHFTFYDLPAINMELNLMVTFVWKIKKLQMVTISNHLV